VETLIQVSTTEFTFNNISTLPQLLVVGDAEFGATGTSQIAPGESVTYPFPGGIVDGLLIEVITMDTENWRNTGALELSSVLQADDGALWIQNAETFSVGWTTVLGELQHEAPITGLLSEAYIAAHAGLLNYEELASMHIPVPIPGDDTDGPPVVEDDPLPVV